MCNQTSDPENVVDNRLDGNVLAGPLGEVFAADVTTARVICVGCGTQQTLAALEVYGGGPGFVSRCTGCHGVILRVSHVLGRVYVDLRGTVSLQIDL